MALMVSSASISKPFDLSFRYLSTRIARSPELMSFTLLPNKRLIAMVWILLPILWRGLMCFWLR